MQQACSRPSHACRGHRQVGPRCHLPPPARVPDEHEPEFNPRDFSVPRTNPCPLLQESPPLIPLLRPPPLFSCFTNPSSSIVIFRSRRSRPPSKLEVGDLPEHLDP